MHIKTTLCLVALFVLFATACTSGQRSGVVATVAPTDTEAVEPAATEVTEPPSAVTGFILGKAHLMAPPTPPLVIYAVDIATGAWVSVETPETDGETDFVLELAPGSYHVFAFPVGLGYSLDGDALTPVTVRAGQTTSGITLAPPGPSDCGPMFGIPASPDGRYAEVASAMEGCYMPVSLEVCQTLQDIAAESLSTTFTMELYTPFMDPASGETGLGCTLTATGTGADFPDPGQVTADLVSAFMGWTELPMYQAGGPTGAATAMSRDMGLMLIHAEWMPVPDIECPPDQPISACELEPEQKLVTIEIQAAQK